jgi:hypothetical protein
MPSSFRTLHLSAYVSDGLFALSTPDNWSLSCPFQDREPHGSFITLIYWTPATLGHFSKWKLIIEVIRLSHNQVFSYRLPSLFTSTVELCMSHTRLVTSNYSNLLSLIWFGQFSDISLFSATTKQTISMIVFVNICSKSLMYQQYFPCFHKDA